MQTSYSHCNHFAVLVREHREPARRRRQHTVVSIAGVQYCIGCQLAPWADVEASDVVRLLFPLK
jgi:hypothetical protein